MTEEEKKAIEKLKSYKELFSKGYCKDCNELCVIDNFPSKDLENNIDTLLNLIEKLQKENGELKENERYMKDFFGEEICTLKDDKERFKRYGIQKEEEIKELKSNSITKDKIREKIKDLQNDYNNDVFIGYEKITGEAIKKLKELLEEE